MSTDVRLSHAGINENNRNAKGSKSKLSAYKELSKDPVNWMLDSRYDAPTEIDNELQRQLGRNVPVFKSKNPGHTDTNTSPESQEWVQKLKRAHREMTFPPSPDADADLWSVHHIPCPLRSSKPSPVSGFDNSRSGAS
ncbi:hypothetical protein FGB62_42g39 [Gracilaria domingensis]|nr:hypothetical protein FGB62_42g39 [Gracilaria domingensis]